MAVGAKFWHINSSILSGDYSLLCKTEFMSVFYAAQAAEKNKLREKMQLQQL